MNDVLGVSFGFLIGSIERPIEELTLASGMIASSYSILQDHYQKVTEHLASVEKLLTAIREQHERIRKIFSFRVLSKGAAQPLTASSEIKDFKVEVENHALTINNQNVLCFAKSIATKKNHAVIYD